MDTKGADAIVAIDTKTGKTTYPSEAKADIQKYLELQPEGPMAAQAKELLGSLGENIQTTFGKQKKK